VRTTCRPVAVIPPPRAIHPSRQSRVLAAALMQVESPVSAANFANPGRVSGTEKQPPYDARSVNPRLLRMFCSGSQDTADFVVAAFSLARSNAGEFNVSRQAPDSCLLARLIHFFTPSSCAVTYVSCTTSMSWASRCFHRRERLQPRWLSRG